MTPPQRTFLVTGGAGFIGSRIADRLLNIGNRVVIADDLSSGHISNLPVGAEFHHLDLSKEESYSELPKITYDAVFHLAAQSASEVSYYDPELDLRSNALATIRLLRWCKSLGISRFLFASSMGVYGTPKRLPVSEGVELSPISNYGISKLACEHYVRRANDEGMRTTSFRLFNVYGPGQDLSRLQQGIVSIYLYYFLFEERVIVKGSPDRFRDLVYIDDVVDVWLQALDNPNSYGKTYNLGSGRACYVHEMLSMLSNACKRPNHPVQFQEGTPNDQFGLWADISLLSRDLNWKPPTSLMDGLEKMVAWGRTCSLKK